MEIGRIIELMDKKEGRRYYELKVYSFSDYLDVLHYFKLYNIQIDYKSTYSNLRVRYLISYMHKDGYSLVPKRGYIEFSWEDRNDLAYQLRITRIVYVIRFSAFSHQLAKVLLSFNEVNNFIYKFYMGDNVFSTMFMKLLRDSDPSLYTKFIQYVI